MLYAELNGVLLLEAVLWLWCPLVGSRLDIRSRVILLLLFWVLACGQLHALCRSERQGEHHDPAWGLLPSLDLNQDESWNCSDVNHEPKLA